MDYPDKTNERQLYITLQSRVDWDAKYLLTRGQDRAYFIRNERGMLKYLKEQDVDCTSIDFYKRD